MNSGIARKAANVFLSVVLAVSLAPRLSAYAGGSEGESVGLAAMLQSSDDVGTSALEGDDAVAGDAGEQGPSEGTQDGEGAGQAPEGDTDAGGDSDGTAEPSEEASEAQGDNAAGEGSELSFASEADGQDTGQDAGDASEQAAASDADKEPSAKKKGMQLMARGDRKPGVYLTLTDADGKPLPSESTVNRTDTIKGRLDVVFADDPSGQPFKPVANGNTQFRYQFPWGINLVPEENDIIVNGRKAAHYRVQNDGNGNSWVTFDFDRAWLVSNPNNIKVGLNFSFKFARNVQENNDDWSGYFPFTDGSTTLHFNPGGILGYKSASTPDANGDVEFTVNFTLKSAAKNFEIVDSMGKNLTFKADTFTFGPAGAEEPIALTVTDAGDVWQATGVVGDLEAGRYVLKYKAHADEAAAKLLKSGEVLSDVTNTIVWRYGEPGAKTESEPDSATPRITREALNKKLTDSALSEEVVDGKRTYTLKWSVTVNNGSLKVDNLSNKKLTDTIETGTYVPGSLVVTGPDGEYENGVVEPLAGNKGFTYTFGPDAGTAHYTLTYLTELQVDAEGDDGVAPAPVKNKVTLEVEGEQSQGEDVTDTTIPGVNPEKINKEGGERQETEEGGRTSWKIQVGKENIWTTSESGSNEIADSVEVTDTLSGNNGVSYDRGSMKVHLVTSDGTELATSDYQVSWSGRSFTVKIEKAVLDRLNTADGFPLYVTYDTVDDGTMGEATNESSIKTKKEDEVVANYADKETMDVVNNGGLIKRDEDTSSVWDDEKGCWIVTWVVQANTSVPYGKALGGKVELSGQPLTITDTLGEGLAYVEGSARYKILDDGYWKTSTGGVSRNYFSSGAWYDAQVSAAGQVLTISTETLEPFAYTETDDEGNEQEKTTSGKPLVYFEYQTEVSDEVLKSKSEGGVSQKVAEVSNHVDADIGGTPATDDAKATVNENQLSKESMRRSGTNEIVYSIVFNDKARDLYDKGDVIHLVDTMDPRTTFKRDSLKVTADGEDITSSVTLEFSDVNKPASDDSSNSGAATQMVLGVPDGKRLVISYTVLLNGVEGEDIQVSNEIEAVEVVVPPAVNNPSYEVLQANAYAEGSGTNVGVLKLDSSDQPIDGQAVFGLFKIDLNAWKAGAEDLENIGTAGDIVDLQLTDENGYAGLADLSISEDSTSVLANTLYAILEIEAPVGYALNPVPFFIMIQSETDPDSYDAAMEKAASLGITPRTAPDGITVAVHDKLGVEITLVKKWEDNSNKDNTRPSSVRFQVYQNGTPYYEPYELNTSDLSETDADVWEGVIGGLPRFDEDGNEYVYTIEELPVSNYESSAVTSKVLVSNEEDVNTQMTITNTLSLEDGGSSKAGAAKAVKKTAKTGDDAAAAVLAGFALAMVAGLGGMQAARRRRRLG